MANPSPAGYVFRPSGAYTTTLTGADTPNYEGYRGIRVTVDTTVFGTGSVTVKIDRLDKASGKYVTLLTGAAIVSVVTNTYVVYPGATAVGNAAANDVIGPIYRIVATANNANSQTYSIGVEMLP